MKPSISFLNKELTRAIRQAVISNRTHHGRMTDNVVETTIEWAKKIVEEPHLRGIALSHVIIDEFRVISSCLIQQSTLNNHFSHDWSKKSVPHVPSKHSMKNPSYSKGFWNLN